VNYQLHAPTTLSPGERSFSMPLNMRLDGSQSWHGRFAGKGNLISAGNRTVISWKSNV
jgi:hypothetical protein